ncbi:MAG: cupin domain-containing protein [Acidobacteriota bacterium]|nr:cupin domain-containing protein [Acidobacteriota bacterium]
MNSIPKNWSATWALSVLLRCCSTCGVIPPCALRTLKELHWKSAPCEPLRHRHFRTSQLHSEGDPALDRIPILFNDDVSLSLVRPTVETSCFYRNAQGDETVYVSEGRGSLDSAFGRIEFRSGDYLVIPRGVLHRFSSTSEKRVLLIIESAGHVHTPKRYSNEYGQLVESSRYSERDIRCPKVW